jgi:hypothetical protein
MTTPQINQFVPLVTTSPSGEKRDFQITVIPQTQQPQTFQSFGNGATSSADRAASKKNCEPTLSVQRDNGRITSIRVQCSCGQTIDVACVYEESPKPA